MSHSALAASVRHLRDVIAAQHRGDESDEQLLHDFANRRDDSAFTVLVRRHGPMVMGVCHRVLGHQQDAEDAFQATFLVFARNAAALRKKTALASFLHGTAYRVAWKAKRAVVRRHKHEGRASIQPPANPADELSWREVRTLLDEEIGRLPEKYRSAFVLCCLENVSRAEAARRLGLKEGTVSSRLAEARKRLQSRLACRGVELTALLAATALTTETASALPAALMAKTTGSAVSPAVAALTGSGSMTLSLGKIKLVAALVLAASALTGAGLWAYRGPGFPSAMPTDPPAAQASDKPKTAPPKREAAKTVEIQGRVFGHDGKPKAGAKLLLLGPIDPAEQQELLVDHGITKRPGVSAADGRFTVAIPKERRQQILVAQADGLGIDFLDLDARKLGKTVELRLVKDHVIRGRVVNTEGKPVAGVRVAVNHLDVYPDNSLDSFLVFWKNRPFNFGPRGGIRLIQSGTGTLLTATTDADGRFALHGVGEERLVSLRLSGGGIAADDVWVVNRAGFDPKPYNQATLDNLPEKEKKHANLRWMLSGPDVSVIVASEKIIRGIVTEADTGKVHPGVLVRLTRKNGDDHTGGDYLSLTPKAKTDAQGRYEIHGAHKAKSYLVEVGSDSATGYLGRGVWAEDTLGYQPITADIRVRKGVIVTGKMIDQSTGKPVDGYVVMADLFDNPFVKEYSDDSGLTVLNWFFHFAHTDANGVFRAVTIPGPVLLMGVPNGRNRSEYKSSVPDPKYPQYFEKREDHYDYRGSGTTHVWGSFCKVLQIKPGVAVVKQVVVLERERRNVLGTVKIQDAEGKPLPEVDVWAWGAPNRIEGDSCTIYGEATDKPHFLVFYEPKQKRAGTLNLKAGEKLPPVVKLKPMGSVTGRLLDADGKPLEGIVVAPRYRNSTANGMNSYLHEDRPIASDANGVFTLDSLISELPFDLSFRRGRRDFERQTKPTDPAVQVKPGGCRDVGAIKLKRVPEKPGK